MVYRIYVEKKKELANEAKSLKSDLINLLGIKGIEDLRIINRYDAENIEKDLFDYCKTTVFSEPQLDIIYDELNVDNGKVFAVEYLPGQFDQRANSASECIQLISKGDRPDVKTATIYIITGDVSDNDIEEIKTILLCLQKEDNGSIPGRNGKIFINYLRKKAFFLLIFHRESVMLC